MVGTWCHYKVWFHGAGLTAGFTSAPCRRDVGALPRRYQYGELDEEQMASLDNLRLKLSDNSLSGVSHHMPCIVHLCFVSGIMNMFPRCVCIRACVRVCVKGGGEIVFVEKKGLCFLNAISGETQTPSAISGTALN